MKAGGILVAAEFLGSSFLSDPELQPPQNPRLPPEIIVLPFGRDGLLFEGGKTTQVLIGSSSRTLLPAVLEQLDGTKTWDEIAAAVPFASLDDVRNVVTLLFSRGLLEDGVSPPPPDELRDLDAFLGRFVDVTRNNRNRGEAMGRLRDSRVAVAGPPRSAETIATQLIASGVRPRMILYDRWEDLAEIQLLIAVATQMSQDLNDLLKAAHDSGTSVLHIRMGRTEAQIGPLFIPGRTGCYECMRALHELPNGDADTQLMPLWLSLASLQAVQFVSRIADIRLVGGFESYEQTPQGIVQQHRYVARLPGCSRCGIAGLPLEYNSPEMLAWLYHTSVGIPPREVSSRRAHQRHYLAENIVETNRRADSYPGSVAMPLPEGKLSGNLLSRLEAGQSRRVIELESLAALLKYAAGYQDVGGEELRRIAPTGGAMGSPEFFVIVNRVNDLRPGIYHYDAPRHVLEWLREAVPEETSAALGVSSLDQPCVIVGVGALQKLRGKYQNFAYRIVNIDAGVALRFLLDVASVLGIGTQELTGIHDRALASLIRVPQKDNQYVVTFALGLGGNADLPAREVTKLGVGTLDALILESVLPTQSELISVVHDDSEPIGANAETFGEYLLSRRSLRSYADRPVSRSSVRFLAEAAGDADRERLLSGVPGLPLRQWWLVRVGSPRLKAGIYEFISEGRRLVHRGPAPTENDLNQCLNQTGLSASPTILVLTADLGGALRSRGARGYREMLLQTGTVCGRVSIAAESLGLGACMTAGIVEDGFRRLSACDGYNDCPTIALTVGHAREQ